MSQAKVEQYKKEKANRKKTLAKHKARIFAVKACACLVVIAACAFGGVKVYNYYEANLPAEEYYVDLSSMTDYMNGLE